MTDWDQPQIVFLTVGHSESCGPSAQAVLGTDPAIYSRRIFMYEGPLAARLRQLIAALADPDCPQVPGSYDTTSCDSQWTWIILPTASQRLAISQLLVEMENRWYIPLKPSVFSS